LSRFVLGSFYARIAADVAAVGPEAPALLEVGCGPGHLSTVWLARRHGLDVTGLDLDPAMIERAPSPSRARRRSRPRAPRRHPYPPRLGFKRIQRVEQTVKSKEATSS
jgi:SAM-dependent methyltransferase